MDKSQKKEFQSVFTPAKARRLLKMGNPIFDIKPQKEDREKSIFLFKITDKFKADLIKVEEEFAKDK